MEGGTPTLLTQRNDCLLNSYNPVQLSAWRANVDMQYIVSRNRVLNHIAKYAAKSEPRSKCLKAVYSNVLKTLKSDGSSLKIVQKLMISSVGERDYSAQETCHLLLGLPMYRALRDFVILSLDGSRQVDNNQEEGTAVVTLASQLDHYRSRPTHGRNHSPGICAEVPDSQECWFRPRQQEEGSRCDHHAFLFT